MIAIPNLAEQLDGQIEEWGNSKPSGHRASEVGFPCARYLVHAQKDWQARPAADIGLRRMFREGNSHERQIMAQLIGMGAEVWGQQDTMRWDELNINGRPDGKIYFDGHKGPYAILEIKTTNTYCYSALNTPLDFLEYSALTIKWYGQIQLYMLLGNTEWATMLIKDRQWGSIKQINFDLDVDYAEKILQRIELANKYLAGDGYPDKINKPELCSRCSFAHVCMPDLRLDGSLDVIDDEEVERLVAELQETAEAHKRHENINKQLKSRLPDQGGEYICGDWLIKQTPCSKEAYQCRATSYIMRKYVSLTEGADNQEKAL